MIDTQEPTVLLVQQPAAYPVQVESPSFVIANHDEVYTLIIPNDVSVVQATTEETRVIAPTDVAPMVVAHGNQGPPGIQGQPGVTAGLLLSRIAGQPLSAHRVVFQDDADNRVRYVDPQADSIAEVLGITTTATSASGEIVYVQSAGELNDPSFAFLPGPVFVGANGVLTQDPPTTGAALQVGVATTLTALLIRIQQPIYF